MRRGCAVTAGFTLFHAKIASPATKLGAFGAPAAVRKIHSVKERRETLPSETHDVNGRA